MLNTTSIGTVLGGNIRDTTTTIDEFIEKLQAAKAQGHTSLTFLYVTDALEAEDFGEGGDTIVVVDYDKAAHDELEEEFNG